MNMRILIRLIVVALLGAADAPCWCPVEAQAQG